MQFNNLYNLLIESDKPICKIYNDGTKEWWLNGKRHREDGPAVEWASGYKHWWLNGEQYSEPNYYRQLYKLGKITKEELFIKLL